MLRSLKKRLFAVCLIVSLLLTTVPATVFASSVSGTLLSQFSYTGGTADTDIACGTKTTGYGASLGDMTVYTSVNGVDPRKLEWTKDAYTHGNTSQVQPTMTAGSNNPWAVGAYIEVQLCTVGYTDISFSAKLGGTKKGPADFKLQYSTDGVTFVDVGASYTITTNKVMQQAFLNVALPADAENLQTLFIRMVNTSDVLISGATGLSGATGGETAVNDIVITGTGNAMFYPQGDSSMDYDLTTTDARATLEHIVGIRTLSNTASLLADITADDTLTTSDVRMVLLSSLKSYPFTYSPENNGYPSVPSGTGSLENVITLLGTTAEVQGTGASVSGDTVTISESGTYRITGTMTDGRVLVAADATADNVTLRLDNAAITCSYTSPLFIQTADNVTVELIDGTNNALTDGGAYTDTTPNAALCAKCDMDIEGSGTLTVIGNYNNGIGTNDDLKIKGGTISVTAVNHALKGNDSITVSGGDLTLVASADGMQADNTDTDKGYITINDGVIDITAANDAVQAENSLVVNGGTISAVTGGGSSTSPSSTDTNSYKGLKSAVGVTVTGGTIDLDCKDDTIHSNGDVFLTGGTMTCASGDDGVHADGTLQIEGDAVLTVTKSYEAFEGVNMIVKGGTSRLTASDDGVNAAGGTDDNTGYWYVENDLLYVVASTTAGYEFKLTTDAVIDVAAQPYLDVSLSSDVPYDIVLDIDADDASGTSSLATDWYSELGIDASQITSGYLPATSGTTTNALNLKGYFEYNGIPSDGQATVTDILVKLSGQGTLCLGALQASSSTDITTFALSATGSVITSSTVATDIRNLLQGTAHTAVYTESSSAGSGGSMPGMPGMGGNMGGGMTSETVGNLTMMGGYLAVTAGGDGIDINGNAIMTGGTMLVHGPSDSGNAALDFDGTFDINGGTFVAAGSSGMLQTPSTSSTQYILSTKISSSKSGGTLFGILDASGNTIVAFKPSKTYQSVIVSTPSVTKGVTYTAYTGGSASGNVLDGLYDGAYTKGTSVGSKSVSSIVTSIGSSSNRW